MVQTSQNFKKYFVSFADSRMSASLQRIVKQAKDMDVYDAIYAFDETKLSPDFRSKFEDKLIFGSRGYGYWCWKPQVILQVFEKMEKGDVLQYTDTGCHLNAKGRDRLLEYFQITKDSESGVLAFRSRSKDELNVGDTFLDYNDLNYTKMDLLHYFGVDQDHKLARKPQYGGTICFIRKDSHTEKFLKDWLLVFEEHFHLADDSQSVLPNHPEFIENRHDQSIFSLLCKTRGAAEIFDNEYWTAGDWNELEQFPIWAKRDKVIPWYKKYYYKYFGKKYKS